MLCTVVLEKTLERPLDSKEIQPVHSKGNQSWIVIGRTDAEAETPILWPPDAKNWLIGKVPDDGKDWRQEEKGMTEGWDGWTASRTQWMWVWVNSGRWWWTGRPGVLRFMGSQRVGHDWATELSWTDSPELLRNGHVSVPFTMLSYWLGIAYQKCTFGTSLLKDFRENQQVPVNYTLCTRKAEKHIFITIFILLEKEGAIL